MGNIFYKLTAENFPNLEKEMPIQVQETSSTPKRHDQNSTKDKNSYIKVCKREKLNNI
jgi:hypothetical protein